MIHYNSNYDVGIAVIAATVLAGEVCLADLAFVTVVAVVGCVAIVAVVDVSTFGIGSVILGVGVIVFAAIGGVALIFVVVLAVEVSTGEVNVVVGVFIATVVKLLLRLL